MYRQFFHPKIYVVQIQLCKLVALQVIIFYHSLHFFLRQTWPSRGNFFWCRDCLGGIWKSVIRCRKVSRRQYSTESSIKGRISEAVGQFGVGYVGGFANSDPTLCNVFSSRVMNQLQNIAYSSCRNTRRQIERKAESLRDWSRSCSRVRSCRAVA
jgi:hypothetical protein